MQRFCVVNISNEFIDKKKASKKGGPIFICWDYTYPISLTACCGV